MRPRRAIAAAVVLAAAAAPGAPAAGQELRFTPEAAAEVRAFPRAPAHDGQFGGLQPALVLTGDGRWMSADRDVRVLFEPYLRIDGRDDERTYADLREASVSVERGDWDLLVGVSTVFWGVAETRNVVDVINQVDAVEDVDLEEKLGQPMVRVSRRVGRGTVEAYWLPYFREREFPGREGRLRAAAVVDEDEVRYDRAGGEWAGDAALRFTTRAGGFDVGAHVFHGTSREPRLVPDPATGRLEPVYPELSQTGLDLQYTSGPWLLKGEAVAGEVGGERFSAAVVGFEYTFFDVGGRGVDVGVVGEYLHDDRDPRRAPATVFDDDVIAGVRLTWNDVQDTELLFGAIVDRVSGAVQGATEFQRRIGDRMLLEAEGRLFRPSGDPLLDDLRRDDVLLVRLTRYF